MPKKKIKSYEAAKRFAATKRKKGYNAHVAGSSSPWIVYYVKK